MNRHGVLRSRNRPGRFRRRPWRGRPYQWPCDWRLAVASGKLPAGALSDLQLFGTKDLYAWRRGEDFAEVAHPVLRVFGCTDTSAAKLIELIKVRQLDFELQSRAASVAPRQWILSGRLRQKLTAGSWMVCVGSARNLPLNRLSPAIRDPYSQAMTH
jgi:hypothetical protein